MAHTFFQRQPPRAVGRRLAKESMGPPVAAWHAQLPPSPHPPFPTLLSPGVGRRAAVHRWVTPSAEDMMSHRWGSHRPLRARREGVDSSGGGNDAAGGASVGSSSCGIDGVRDAAAAAASAAAAAAPTPRRRGLRSSAVRSAVAESATTGLETSAATAAAAAAASSSSSSSSSYSDHHPPAAAVGSTNRGSRSRRSVVGGVGGIGGSTDKEPSEGSTERRRLLQPRRPHPRGEQQQQSAGRRGGAASSKAGSEAHRRQVSSVAAATGGAAASRPAADPPGALNSISSRSRSSRSSTHSSKIGGGGGGSRRGAEGPFRDGGGGGGGGRGGGNGRKSGGPGGGGSTAAAATTAVRCCREEAKRINSAIIEAGRGRRYEDILQVTEEHAAKLNHVNVATALHRLGSCGLQPGGREAERLLTDPRFNELLLRLTAGQHLPSFTGREVANCLWALAKLGYQQRRGAAATELEARQQQQQQSDGMAGASSSGRHNCGSGSGSGGSLLEGLCVRAEATLGSFGPQEVANALWALGAIGHHPGEPLLRGLTTRLLEVLPELAPQGVSNSLLGLAKLGWSPGGAWLDEVARGSVPRIGDFEPQALSNVLWSLARLGHRNPQLQAAVFQQALRRIADFVPQGVANLVWAAATLGLAPRRAVVGGGGGGGEGGCGGSEGSAHHHHQQQQQQAGLMPEPLLRKCCDQAVATLQSYTPQNLSNLLWASAKMGYRHEPLLRAAAGRAAQDLAAASLSRNNKATTAAAVGEDGSSRGSGGGGGGGGGTTTGGGDLLLRSWSSQEVANAAWAYATLESQPGANFLGQVCRHVARSASDYKWQELANVTWALASLQHHDTPALVAVEREVVARMMKAASSSGNDDDNDGMDVQLQPTGAPCPLQPMDVSMLLWAYATLQHPAPRLFAALLPILTRHLDHYTNAELISSLCAAATLKVYDEQAMDAIAEHIRVHRLPYMQLHHVAKIAWAYGELRHAHKALLDGLVARAASSLAAPPTAPAGSSSGGGGSGVAANNQHLARLCCAAGIFGWRYPALLGIVAEGFATLSRRSSSGGYSGLQRAGLDDDSGGWSSEVCTTAAASMETSSSREAAQRLEVVAVNLAWSLSLVGGCSPAIWRQLMELLGPPGGMGEEKEGGCCGAAWLPDAALRQLYQTYMHVQLDYPTAALATGPPGLLGRAAEVWRLNTKWGAQVSSFQREVSEAVNRLGLRHTLEWLLDDGDFSIDLAVEAGVQSSGIIKSGSGEGIQRIRIAVEAEGPTHFTSNTRQPLGTTLYRRRCLEARGWVVVSVPYWRWYQRPSDNNSPAGHDMLLLELLGEAGLEVAGVGEVLAVAARGKPPAPAPPAPPAHAPAARRHRQRQQPRS